MFSVRFRKVVWHLEFFVLLLNTIASSYIPVRRSVQDVANGIVPPVLTVCFVVEDDSYFGNYGRLAAAVDLGIEHANAFVMPNTTKLQVVFQSSGTSCTRTLYSAVTAMLDMMDKGTTCDMYLGTTCAFTTAALYGFAVKYNAPIFGIPSSGVSAIQPDSIFSDFRLLTQPAFGYSDCADFLIQLLDLMNYSSLVIFRDDSYSFFTTFADQVLRFFRDKRPSIYQTTYTSAIRSKRYSVAMIKPLLAAANTRSRVFILFAHAAGVRNIMIAAHQLGYTNGEHVFFVLQLYELDYWGNVDATIGDGFDDAMKDAYSSILLLSFYETTELYDHQFEKSIKTNARNRYGYSFNPLETLDPVLLGHYDSVMLYATTVATMMDEKDANFTNGYEIVSRITNRTFQGVRGNTIVMGEDGQRDKNYMIQFYDSKVQEFVPYLLYLQHTTFNESFRTVRPLRWPGGQLPPNEPVCGFRNDKYRQEGLPSSTLAIAVVIPLLVLSGLAVGAGLVFYKMWKLRMDFNPNWWKVPSDELSVKDNRPNAVEGSKRTLRSQSSAGTQRSGFSSYMCEIFATYKGTLVGLVDVSEQKRAATKELLAELTLIKAVEHVNLQHFIGIAVNPQDQCEYIVAELCSKGTLQDIIENDMIKLDWFFKNSIIRDIVLGMAYLHGSPIGSHGSLTTYTCLVDTRFTIKIAQNLAYFSNSEDLRPFRENEKNADRPLTYLLWRAPELLRQQMPPKGTPKGDIYSFAIVLQQIILRSEPFELPNDPLDLTDSEILIEVVASNIPPVRPRVPRSACSNELYDLMEQCWEEVPIERPTFAKIKDRLRKIMGNIGDNIVDLLFKRMETYAADLEMKVAEKTQQFMDEKNRSEQLLSQLLPKSVAENLTKGIEVNPEAYESVTIFFSDIVGFTTKAAQGSPMEVVDLLNSLYTFFDNILEKYDVYKVETIGDAYMVSSGLPVRNGNRHASEIASMALDLLRGITNFHVPRHPNESIEIRAGINSGSCVAGIVGLKMPRYCLFGDTVNTASRMESLSEPMKIQCTVQTKDLLEAIGGFVLAERGPIAVKGKGMLTTYWLLGKR